MYADHYLQKFVSGIYDLCGSQNVSISCHLLTHLKRCVEQDFAQFCTHSASIYESFNNEIKEAVHSSNGAEKQGILRCVRPSDIVWKLINFPVDISHEVLNLAVINVLLAEVLS